MVEQLRVDPHQRQVGRDIEPDVVALEDLPRVVDRAGHRVGQVGRLDMKRERARLDARHVEQIGDETAAAAAPLSRTSSSSADGASRAHLGATAQDRGERRAQIVADRRQQRRAQAIAIAELRDSRISLSSCSRSSTSDALVDQAHQQRQLIRTDGIRPSSRAMPSTASLRPADAADGTANRRR